MRYRVLSLAAVLVFAGSTYLFCTKLTGLLDTGTCASGGPYEISRPCPEGTGTDTLLMMASVLGLFVAVGLLGLRGGRPGGGGGFSFGSMMLAGWALFFTISGAVSLVHAQTSEVIGDDGKLGGTIVGATFLLLGVPVLLFLPWMIINGRKRAGGVGSPEAVYAGAEPGGQGWTSMLRSGSKLMGDLSSQMTTGGSVGSADSVGSTGSSSFGSSGDGDGDTISQLERLDRLRQSGALTEAEFAAEKARILSSGR